MAPESAATSGAKVSRVKRNPFFTKCLLPDFDATQRRLDATELRLTELYFWWHFRIHEGCTAIRVNDLSRNPTGLFRTEQRHNVADIFRCAQAPHRCPT